MSSPQRAPRGDVDPSPLEDLRIVSLKPANDQKGSRFSSTARFSKGAHVPAFLKDDTNASPSRHAGDSPNRQRVAFAGGDSPDAGSHSPDQQPLSDPLEPSPLSPAYFHPLVLEMEKSLTGRSGLQSKASKVVTAASHLGRDPRYDHIPSPSGDIGPGSYDWDKSPYCPPWIGTLDARSPSRGGSPSRDPTREGAAFSSPTRQGLFKDGHTSAGSHLGGYAAHRDLAEVLKAEKGKGKGARGDAEWSRRSGRRAEVADWRYGTRYSEARKEVPEEEYLPPSRPLSPLRPPSRAASAATGGVHTGLPGLGYGGGEEGRSAPASPLLRLPSGTSAPPPPLGGPPSTPPSPTTAKVATSCSGHLMEIAAQAGPSGSRLAAVAFQSKQPRLGKLPVSRVNDSRLATARRDEDPGALGPGSYLPYTSLGAAKRTSYRFMNAAGYRGGGGGGGGSPGQASRSFTSVHRGVQSGPFPADADSTLKRF